MTTPTVSVVIPTYNSADTVARAIDSALGQTVPPTEILVIDDASSDDTAARLAAYADRSVRHIRLGQRGGAAHARNAGIAAATGDFVAFLDADDEWLPAKLARQLDLFEQDPSLVFAACRSLHIGRDGQVLGLIHHQVPVATGPEAWKALLAHNFLATPTVLVRRDALLAVGLFDRSLPIAEDQDLWIRLALHGALGYVDDILTLVHDRAGSLSKTPTLQGIDILLPVVLGHLARERHRLSPAERRYILGCRYTRIGRDAYRNRMFLRGTGLLLRAALLGYRPVGNLMFLAKMSPPSLQLKHMLGWH